MDDGHQSSPPDTGGLNSGVEAVTINVVVPDPEVKRGGPLTVDVVLDNNGAPPYRIIFGTGCQFTWFITSTDGRVVTRNTMCTQATSYIELGSDGRYTRQLSIPTIQTYEQGWPYEQDSLPPGRYKLEVYLFGYQDRMSTEIVWFEVLG